MSLFSSGLRFFAACRRDIRPIVFKSQGFLVPEGKLHSYEVYYSFEIVAFEVRRVKGNRIGVQSFLYLSYDLSRNQPRSYPSCLRNTILGTLYLSACFQTVSDWGSTPPTESKTTTAPSRTLSDLSTSIVKSTWPGRVDDVYPVVVPETGRGSGSNGNTPLPFLLHPVHGGRAFMNFADLVSQARYNRGCARS